MFKIDLYLEVLGNMEVNHVAQALAVEGLCRLIEKELDSLGDCPIRWEQERRFIRTLNRVRP